MCSVFCFFGKSKERKTGLALLIILMIKRLSYRSRYSMDATNG